MIDPEKKEGNDGLGGKERENGREERREKERGEGGRGNCKGGDLEKTRDDAIQSSRRGIYFMETVTKMEVT